MDHASLVRNIVNTERNDSEVAGITIADQNLGNVEA